MNEVESANLESRTTYRLDLEYDGTGFQGWQVQPAERTVQQCVQEAVEALFREKTCVYGAGRTDAGVHATGQVAHFRVNSFRPTEVVFRALNALMPEDVRVTKVTLPEPDFHARYSAHWRGYRYLIARHQVAIERRFCWSCGRVLDVSAMREAAHLMLGDHRFESFAHSSEKETHYLSTVYRADWVESERFYEFYVEANRFLHGMVRFLVGTFVDAGRGKISTNQVLEIASALDVRNARPKAPARGLSLVCVGYRPWPEV
jgi:tRNA pseudouridine38-40 synthase